MSSSPGEPLRWTPHGCTDALATGALDDGSEKSFHGAMQSLANLVPDPTTTDLWICRPAAIQKTAFAGFPVTGTPGFISSLLVAGDMAYGMIAMTGGTFNGKDVPFVYGLETGSFVTITGLTAANTPTSLATTGAWTPPHMELVGVYVVVCHTGFDGVTHFVGWLNIANPAAPTWTSGNTATNALPSVPVWASQFNGRAYYLCNPAGVTPSAILSDSLDPTTRSNANYVLTFGTNEALIAAIGLPLSNQLGGIIQSLMVFTAENVFQITGDPTSNSLSKNSLNVAIGTSAPLSIVETPEGIAFVAPDGLRTIDFNARLSDPKGFAGQGITNAFKQAVTPSRIVAACNATTIRISVQNGAATGQPVQEWCYDLQRQIWFGPHTLTASLIQPWGASFVVAPTGLAGLWQSDIIPLTTSTYIENGTRLSWTYWTSMLPSLGDDMSMCSIVESQLWAAYDANAYLFAALALDADGNSYAGCQLTGVVGAGGIWGQGRWGQMLWGGVVQALRPRRLKWPVPIVFDRLSIQVMGQSGQNVRLGDFTARVRQLGYVPNQ